MVLWSGMEYEDIGGIRLLASFVTYLVIVIDTLVINKSGYLVFHVISWCSNFGNTTTAFVKRGTKVLESSKAFLAVQRHGSNNVIVIHHEKMKNKRAFFKSTVNVAPIICTSFTRVVASQCCKTVVSFHPCPRCKELPAEIITLSPPFL